MPRECYVNDENIPCMSPQLAVPYSCEECERCFKEKYFYEKLDENTFTWFLFSVSYIAFADLQTDIGKQISVYVEAYSKGSLPPLNPSL